MLFVIFFFPYYYYLGATFLEFGFFFFSVGEKELIGGRIILHGRRPFWS